LEAGESRRQRKEGKLRRIGRGRGKVSELEAREGKSISKDAVGSVETIEACLFKEVVVGSLGLGPDLGAVLEKDEGDGDKETREPPKKRGGSSDAELGVHGVGEQRDCTEEG
jgi:hypothetical protein